MTQEKRKFEDWLDYARKAKRVALLAHISPDGDTLGSTLALRLAFLAMGKQVDVICDGDVPDNLKFLTGSESILHPEDVNGSDYDTAIAVDVSDRSLLGKSETVFDAAGIRMVIDHHATNPAYGQVNFIRGGESACCLLAYEAICGHVPADGHEHRYGSFPVSRDVARDADCRGKPAGCRRGYFGDDAQIVSHSADEPCESDTHCL